MGLMSVDFSIREKNCDWDRFDLFLGSSAMRVRFSSWSDSIVYQCDDVASRINLIFDFQ